MRCSTWHFELNENGEGKCSVPMWSGYGMPAGFCDNPAYGKPTLCETFRARNGEIFRVDGKRSGYVPGLACYAHGGPKHRYHKGNPCIYCGTLHDDVAPGPCPGKAYNNNCKEGTETAPCLNCREGHLCE